MTAATVAPGKLARQISSSYQILGYKSTAQVTHNWSLFFNSVQTFFSSLVGASPISFCLASVDNMSCVKISDCFVY